MSQHAFDIVVLGGGPGGYVAAIKAAQLGYRTALIEKHKLGGVCLNYGCIPTKTLLKTAKLFKEFQHARVFGINLPEGVSPTIDWPQMMHRKDKVVHQLTSGVQQLLQHNKVDVFNAFGDVTDQNTVQLETGEVIAYKYLIIATGSSSVTPDLPGLKDAIDAGIAIDSTGAISLAKQPKTMIILGGGVIAVEFATLYASLGTKVTLIQRSKEILSTLDHDVRETMQKHLIKSGIQIITEATIQGIDQSIVKYVHQGKTFEISGEKILVSLGRQPNLKGIEKLNLERDKTGIQVDAFLRTSKPNIYAIGDVNGKMMLAHVASAEGITAVEHIHGSSIPVDYNQMPSCIYSFPEVGVVGLTEKEALSRGHDVVISKFPLSVNGKALAEGESVGFVKIVADRKYGEVLGVHIVAIHATDMIAEAVATMTLEGTVHDLARAVHPHPTLSEIVMEAAHGAIGKAIHMKN